MPATGLTPEEEEEECPAGNLSKKFYFVSLRFSFVEIKHNLVKPKLSDILQVNLYLYYVQQIRDQRELYFLMLLRNHKWFVWDSSSIAPNCIHIVRFYAVLQAIFGS